MEHESRRKMAGKVRWSVRRAGIYALGLFFVGSMSIAQAGTVRFFWGNHQTDDTMATANIDASGQEELYNNGRVVGVAADSARESLYFGDVDNGIGRLNLQDNSSEILVSGITSQYVTLDEPNNHLYWSEWGGPVGQYDLAGGSVSDASFATSDNGNTTGVAVGGDYLYFADAEDTVYRKPLTGGTRENFATFDNDPYGIEYHDGTLYVAARDHIASVDENGGVTKIIEGVSGNFDLSVLGDQLYVADKGDQMIYRSNLDGTNQETLLTDADIGDVTFAPFGMEAIPEPSSLLLLSLAGLLLMKRRGG